MTKAATLEIQIVADILRLQNDMRAVEKAVGSATGSATAGFNRTGSAAAKMAADAQNAGRAASATSRDIQRLKASLDPAWASQQEFNRQQQLGMVALKSGAIDRQQFVQHMRQINGELKRAQQPMQQVTNSAGAQRAGMQQLSFQLNDVATMYAMGARPMQIFASQAGQVVQAVQMMTGGTSALARFLGGPWGMAIATATVVLVPFISKLFDTAGAADKATEALQRLIDKRAEEAAKASELGQAETELNKLMKERDQIQRRQDARSRGGTQFQYSSDAQRLLDLNQKILTGQDAVDAERRSSADKGLQNIEAMIAAQAKLAGATTTADRAQADYTLRVQKANAAFAASSKSIADQQKLLQTLTVAERDLNVAQDAARAASSGKADERRAENLARESAATEELIAGLYRTADAYGVSAAAGARARIEAEAMEKGLRKQTDVAAYVAQQQRKSAADLIAREAERTASLSDQTKAQEFVNAAVRAGQLSVENASDALSNMMEQRQLMTAIQIAGANSDVKGYEAATKALKALTEAQISDIAARRVAADLAKADQIKSEIADIELETQLMKDLGLARINALRGLSGVSLDNELARVAAEHEKIAIQTRAEADATKLVKLGYDDAAAAVLAKAEADKSQVDTLENLNDQEKALARLHDRVNALTGAMANLGGAGGKIGNLIGALSGRDPIGALLNMGGIGTVAGLMTGEGQEVYKKQREAIESGLKSVFGDKAGRLTEPLSKVLQGSALGQVSSGVAGNLGLKQSNTGAQLGGALGNFIPGLPPGVGSLIGGVLGGTIGGMLKKTKTGSANITGMGEASLSGNSGAFRANAGGAATSVQDGLAAIAKQLGGGVGGFNVTIGQRHGDWRVREGEGSLKIKKGAKEFDDDQAGAIKYAISLAIQQGALTGMRAATQRLLKGGSDIEAQLQKAISFQGVFDELEKRTNPVAFELKQIGKEFEDLTAIFREAGASADEYAKLEELFALKRKDAMADSAASLREFLDSLAFGSNSPLSLRQQSSSSLASLQPYLDSINAGQSIDQDKYLSAAQSYLDIQRQINGSGQAFFDAFEMIRGATDKAIGNVENVQTLEVSSNATAQNTADIVNLTADTNTLLQEVSDRLAALGGTDARSAWIAQNRNYA